MSEPTIDEQGRTEPPDAGDEVATLVGFLEYQRATLRWKTDGLDTAGMRSTVGASEMTPGGLLKHMALVEDLWFAQRLLARPSAEPWASVDWEADRDWEWHSAGDDAPDDLRRLWNDALARSRACFTDALADGGLDRLADWVDPWSGRTPSLRWIMVHMIEEYARHNGHADLLREVVDGEVGE